MLVGDDMYLHGHVSHLFVHNRNNVMLGIRQIR